MIKEISSTRTRTPRQVATLRAKNRVAPRLVHGMRMNADEFLRIYETMPEDKKAELIDGVVYMFLKLLSSEWHGEPDGLLQYWMASYAFQTPGIVTTPNSTVRLGIKSVPQPDGILRLKPEYGGKTRLDEKGCIVGPVEFAAQIAASSAALDLGKRLQAYCNEGVQEYLVWCTKSETVHWFHLLNGQYVPFVPDQDGVIRSRVFPGLWLDADALLKGDSKQLLTVLKRGMKSAEYKRFVKRK